MSLPGPTEIVLYLLAGAVLGAGFFALLLWTVRLLEARAAPSRIIPLYVIRFAAAIAAFWFLARQGAAPLLLALLGFMAARFVFQRRVEGK